MTNGDDIHNLLKTLGHDAGIYQDLAKYNAARAAVRRAAMGRPTESPAAAAPVKPMLSAPLPSPAPNPTDDVPRVLRLGPDAQNSPSSLASILNRLASPHDDALVHRPSAGQPPARPPTASAASQPVRLDRLFGRLASRAADPFGR